MRDGGGVFVYGEGKVGEGECDVCGKNCVMLIVSVGMCGGVEIDVER